MGFNIQQFSNEKIIYNFSEIKSSTNVSDADAILMTESITIQFINKQ